MKKNTTTRRIRICIRNWKQYNAAIKERGSLTFWISEEAIRNWTTTEPTGQRGASRTCTALAMLTIAMVQAVFDLSGRQCEGFLNSVFGLMKLPLTAPEHSTLSRQRRGLTITLPLKARRKVLPRGGGFDGRESLWRRRVESAPARVEPTLDVAQAARGSG
jgi:hypothetical protein